MVERKSSGLEEERTIRVPAARPDLRRSRGVNPLLSVSSSGRSSRRGRGRSGRKKNRRNRPSIKRQAPPAGCRHC